MAKMTTRQELDKLQAEIEQLRQAVQSTAKPAEASPVAESSSKADQDQNPPADSSGLISEIIESSGLDTEQIRQQAGDLIKQLEEDYDKLSPAIVVLIFAMGALFGRSLSSK